MTVGFPRHIETMAPTFCKVLVRCNPAGDPAMNQRQAVRLKRLSDYLYGSGRQFMFELLVSAERADLERYAGWCRLFAKASEPARQ